MSFKPEDYPGAHPDEWYETYVGKIIGHVSLIRDLIDPEDSEIVDFTKRQNAVPRICFSIGSWENGEWIDGITGGMGVVLALEESDNVPTVLLGDFKEYEQTAESPDESVDIEHHDTMQFPLDRIGYIFGGNVPPEMWRADS